MRDQVKYDFARQSRIGLTEAVLCEGKSTAQIEHIVSLAVDRGQRMLFTRLSDSAFAELSAGARSAIDFESSSRTAILGGPLTLRGGRADAAIVSAGTSDLPVVREAARTLAFHGESSDVIMDIGVAGLWRVLEQASQLESYRVVIVVAGMDGALFSVIGGLVSGVVIAVPTSTGYGASREGQTALCSALASCAPGVAVVNIGNGYGAACAALRALHAQHRAG